MLSSLVYQLKCCCGPVGCSFFCIKPVRISMTTRTMYSLTLMIVSILMIFLHHEKARTFLKENIGVSDRRFNKTCHYLQAGDFCERFFGYLSVYRIGYAFFIFHIVMGLLCICISTENCLRGRLHNGFWFWKFVIIFAIWLAFYAFPMLEQYRIVLTTIGIIAAFLFILIQHISFIDFAYEINGYFRNNSRKNVLYSICLGILTITLYCISLIGYSMLVLQYAVPKPCVLYRVIIIINATAMFLLVFMSLCVGNHIQYKLYLPGGVTCVFVTFLTWTALNSSPPIKVPGNYVPKFYQQYSVQVIDRTQSLKCEPVSLLDLIREVRRVLYDYFTANNSFSPPSTNQTITMKGLDLGKTIIGTSIDGDQYTKIYEHKFGTFYKEDVHAYIGIFIMLAAAVYSSIRSSSEYERYGIKSSKSKKTSEKNLAIISDRIELADVSKYSKFGSSAHIPTKYIDESDEEVNTSNQTPITKQTGRLKATTSLPSISQVMNTSTTSHEINDNNEHVPKSKRKKKTRLISYQEQRRESDIAEEDPQEFNNSYMSSIHRYPIDEFLIHDDFLHVQYSYTWFHFVFGLAYLFVMIQLTNWYSPERSHSLNVINTWPSFWMKMATSWIAITLYAWTLVHPEICIGRKLYEMPLDSMKRRMKATKHTIPNNNEIEVHLE